MVKFTIIFNSEKLAWVALAQNALAVEKKMVSFITKFGHFMSLFGHVLYLFMKLCCCTYNDNKDLFLHSNLNIIILVEISFIFNILHNLQFSTIRRGEGG